MLNACFWAYKVVHLHLYMDKQTQWQWQEEGTAWRGVGIYHVTLTVPSRESLLGTLVIPANDPTQARVERTKLGNAVVDELYVMCRHYPDIRILQFCLMPDHLHAVIHVTRVMDTSIRSVLRGYWQGVKKLGRAYTLSVSPELNSGKTDEGRKTDKGKTDEGGYPFPIFTERPFIRPLSRRGQLRAMIRYVQLNPQRLATKRLMPGFFRVQDGIVIAGRTYSGVGNISLLHREGYATVHVRHDLVDEAAQGRPQRLRDYMNGCVLAARRGMVQVSPFISPQEKAVQSVLLAEQHSFVLLADNGFRDYYKPSDNLFDAVAAGRVLILSPWAYDEGKRHITRSECVALNGMAEEICQCLNFSEKGFKPSSSL